MGRYYYTEDFPSDSSSDSGYQDNPYCQKCNRWFKDNTSIKQHFSNSVCHRFTYCARCDRHFVNGDSKQQHLDASYSHWLCDNIECRQQRKDGADFEDHQERLDHWEGHAHNRCLQCDEDFSSRAVRWQHYLDSPRKHSICVQCGIECKDTAGRRNHMINNHKHSYCRRCDQEFASASQLQQHIEDGSPHYWCAHCSRDLASQNELNQVCFLDVIVNTLILIFSASQSPPPTPYLLQRRLQPLLRDPVRNHDPLGSRNLPSQPHDNHPHS